MQWISGELGGWVVLAMVWGLPPAFAYKFGQLSGERYGFARGYRMHCDWFRRGIDRLIAEGHPETADAVLEAMLRDG